MDNDSLSECHVNRVKLIYFFAMSAAKAMWSDCGVRVYGFWQPERPKRGHLFSFPQATSGSKSSSIQINKFKKRLKRILLVVWLRETIIEVLVLPLRQGF